jgi:hypothetical protein
MGEPLYTARATVAKIAGVHREATLADGTTMAFGVHGPIKEHYRLSDEKNLPLPVDYIVAATTG